MSPYILKTLMHAYLLPLLYKIQLFIYPLNKWYVIFYNQHVIVKKNIG